MHTRGTPVSSATVVVLAALATLASGAIATAQVPAPKQPSGAQPAKAPAKAAAKADKDDDDDDSAFTMAAKGATVVKAMEVMRAKKLEKQARSAAKKRKTASGLSRFVGHMHPILVHFPIAWLVLLLFLDVGTYVRGKDDWEKVGMLVLVGAALSVVMAMAAGLLLGDEVGDVKPKDLFESHRNLAWITSGFLFAALALRAWRKNALEGGLRWVYLGLIGSATVLVLLTGHKGGELVYGKEFLPF